MSAKLLLWGLVVPFAGVAVVLAARGAEGVAVYPAAAAAVTFAWWVRDAVIAARRERERMAAIRGRVERSGLGGAARHAGFTFDRADAEEGGVTLHYVRPPLELSLLDDTADGGDRSRLARAALTRRAVRGDPPPVAPFAPRSCLEIEPVGDAGCRVRVVDGALDARDERVTAAGAAVASELAGLPDARATVFVEAAADHYVYAEVSWAATDGAAGAAQLARAAAVTSALLEAIGAPAASADPGSDAGATV